MNKDNQQIPSTPVRRVFLSGGPADNTIIMVSEDATVAPVTIIPGDPLGAAWYQATRTIKNELQVFNYTGVTPLSGPGGLPANTNVTH